VLPVLARLALGRAERGELKARWIASALGDATPAQAAAWTSHFVPQLIAHGLHADALAAIEQHRRCGDTLVLLSASPDLYVPAIGRALGFTESVCTGLEWREDHLTGRLTTANRRGAEKVRCLKELQQRYPQLPVVAYANAASDLPHLQLAQRGVLVNGAAAARRAAARLGITCVTWH
jgi:phosphatidylglycerophosphatase C